MPNLTEVATYEAAIREFQLTDAAIGGTGGIMNLAIGQLANRTKYLKARADLIDSGAVAPAVAGTAETGPTTAATSDDRRRLVFVLGDGDSPDTLWIAMKLANGTYTWVQIA